MIASVQTRIDTAVLVAVALGIVFAAGSFMVWVFIFV